MKQSISSLWLRFLSFILFTVFSIVTFAQEKGPDIDISVKKESEWYQNPIVWVIGGAVFILLLVALLRSGEKKSA
jgi:cell division protein FtsW (lipid II flippase)